MKPTNCISKNPSPFNALSTFALMMPLLVIATGCKFQQDKPTEEIKVEEQVEPTLRNVYWQLDRQNPNALINSALGVEAMDGSNNGEISVDYQTKGKNILVQEDSNYKLLRPIPFNASNTAHPDVLVIEVSGYFGIDSKIYEATFQCSGVQRPLTAETSFLNGGTIAYFHFSGWSQALFGLPEGCTENKGSLHAKIIENGIEKTLEAQFQPTPKAPKVSHISFKEFDKSGYAFGLNLEPIRHLDTERRKKYELIGITKVKNENQSAITVSIPTKILGGAYLFYKEYYYKEPFGNEPDIRQEERGGRNYHYIHSGAECNPRSEYVGGQPIVVEIGDNVSPDLLIKGLDKNTILTQWDIQIESHGSKLIGIFLEYTNADTIPEQWFSEKSLPPNTVKIEDRVIGVCAQTGKFKGPVHVSGREYYGLEVILNPIPIRVPNMTPTSTLARVKYSNLHEEMAVTNVSYEILPTVVPVADGSLNCGEDCYPYYDSSGTKSVMGRHVLRDYSVQFNKAQ